jgi:hypothetical protein
MLFQGFPVAVNGFPAVLQDGDAVFVPVHRMRIADRHLNLIVQQKARNTENFAMSGLNRDPLLYWRRGMAEVLKLQDRMDGRRAEVSSEQMLENALKARDQLLREHPHLQAYQDEIDRILEKVVGFNERMAVLGFLIEAKIYELKDSVLALRSAVNKVESSIDRREQNRNRLLS